MKMQTVRCFGIDNNTGNKAIIVENDVMNTEERLLFAREQKQTCVFMKYLAQQHSLELDYYYPHARSKLCLHGTLAAAYIYFMNNPQANKIDVITSMNQQIIAVAKENGSIFITVTEQKVEPVYVDLGLIKMLLNLELVTNIVEYYFSSTGSTKLFIEFDNLSIVQKLTPNLDLICEWGKQNNISGLYVYCKLADESYCGRNFNHLDSSLEDAATGVAAAAITSHLKRNLIVHQGDLLNNPCIIITRFLNENIQISGRVSII